MRKQLLDTSLLSAYLFNRPFVVNLISPWIKNREVATSILVYGEVHEYILAHPNYARLHERLLELLEEIPPFFITYSVMRRYGDVRRLLRPLNKLIGDIDTLIASTAIGRNLTLVTADSDFQRIASLKSMVIPRSKLARR